MDNNVGLIVTLFKISCKYKNNIYIFYMAPRYFKRTKSKRRNNKLTRSKSRHNRKTRTKNRNRTMRGG